MINTTPTLSVFAQPENKGQALLQLINGAQSSIDIVIYEINSPDIISNLVAAMGNRGVRVRTVMDNSSTTTKTTNNNFVQNMTAAMNAWTQDGKPAPINNNLFAPHWSSRNFNVTHQKTVIVDAVDASGNPLSPLPDTARLLISTGNFASYNGSPFYSATDFYITLPTPALIQQASTVFNSDFNGDGPTINNVAAGTQFPDGPLIWSNGAWASAQTGDSEWPLNQYPATNGYPYPLPAPSKFTNEGNVAGYLIALVQSAQKGDVLRIYNEELDSDNNTNPVYAELLAAAARGVDVRLMMSYGSGTTDEFAEEQAELARKGGTVTLLAPEEYLQGIPNYSGPTYIHAKALVLSSRIGTFKKGWVGSTNIGNNSFFSNRELGIALGPADAFTADVIIMQFESDWSWYNPQASSPIYAIRWTKANVGSSGYPKAPKEWTDQKTSATTYATRATHKHSRRVTPVNDTILKIMQENCNTLLGNMIKENPNSGISIALFYPGDKSVQPFYQFGLAGPNESISPASVYAIGSVTKVFTATLAAYLNVTEKIGELDQTLVGPYLSNSSCTPSGVSGDYWNQVTFLDFATQTSGMPDEAPGKPSEPLFANAAPNCDTLSWWNNQKHQTSFEKNLGKWIYSSAGFVTLGFATAAAAAQGGLSGGYPNLLAEIITTPLGMADTFTADNAPAQAKLVQGYTKSKAVPVTNSADLKSSAQDMLQWMTAIHNAIELKATGAELTPLQKALALTAKTWIVNPQQPNKTSAFDMGLGWQIPKIGPAQVLMKNGSTSEGGCSCWVGITRYHPSLPPVGIALLTNQVGVRPDETGRTILEQILTEVSFLR